MEPEIRQMIEGYEEFLRGAERILAAFRAGHIRPVFSTVAEEISSVEKQIRDIEAIMRSLRQRYSTFHLDA